jgi:hypothetical protein
MRSLARSVVRSKIGCAQQKQAWKRLQDNCGGARYGGDAWSVYQRAVTSEFVGWYYGQIARTFRGAAEG